MPCPHGDRRKSQPGQSLMSLLPRLPAVWSGWMVVLLLVVSSAGCLGGNSGDGQAGPSQGEPYTWFVCPGDVFVPATPEATGRCNIRVTHDTGQGDMAAIAVDPTDPMRVLVGARDFALGTSCWGEHDEGLESRRQQNRDGDAEMNEDCELTRPNVVVRR